MKRIKLLSALLFIIICTQGTGSAITLIDNSTLGWYNDNLGTILDGTNPATDDYGVSNFLFPLADAYLTYDPTFNSGLSSAPDLSTVDGPTGILGNWLNNNPASLNGNWSPNQIAIPSAWAVNTETAIIYEFDAGATGLTNFDITFNVDNGLFVWLDGVFLNGWLAPGGPGTWAEYNYNLSSISGGKHYLQVLREDHGANRGYYIDVTGNEAPVPEPATMLLFGMSFLGLLGFKKIRK